MGSARSQLAGFPCEGAEPCGYRWLQKCSDGVVATRHDDIFVGSTTRFLSWTVAAKPRDHFRNGQSNDGDSTDGLSVAVV